MKLQIQPMTALCDERIDIRISDLPPYGKPKPRASLSSPRVEKVEYESAACFTANSSVGLDLSKQKPDSGSYDSIDSMGLVVSLKRVKGEFKDLLRNISVNQSLYINATAECG